ncbi:uncharacterized protein LOC119459435 isoform X2 [Dermacentor silvarum]|nr:uncharacterized protein LOC119459435 isoform X2 [Dermacentor silvarum]
MPFKIVRYVHKGCLFGRELHKAKKSISKEVNEASSSPSTSPCKRVKLQRTKKKGCTAVMHIKEVELYPEFSINTPEQCSHWQRQKATAEATHRLRLALHEESTGKPVFREHRFYISMSDKQSHCNHDVDIHACHTQPTNSGVSKEIGELLQRGATPVNTMESCLKFYVTFRDNMSFRMNNTESPDECQNTESPDECQNTESPDECQNTEPPSESQNTESPAVIATQQPDLDLHKALQEKGWFIKRQIRAESQRILSSLYHVHDNAVLERLLCSFMQVRTFIEQSVMKSNGVAARSSSRKGSRGVKSTDTAKSWNSSEGAAAGKELQRITCCLAYDLKSVFLIILKFYFVYLFAKYCRQVLFCLFAKYCRPIWAQARGVKYKARRKIYVHSENKKLHSNFESVTITLELFHHLFDICLLI